MSSMKGANVLAPAVPVLRGCGVRWEQDVLNNARVALSVRVPAHSLRIEIQQICDTGNTAAKDQPKLVQTENVSSLCFKCFGTLASFTFIGSSITMLTMPSPLAAK